MAEAGNGNYEFAFATDKKGRSLTLSPWLYSCGASSPFLLGHPRWRAQRVFVFRAQETAFTGSRFSHRLPFNQNFQVCYETEYHKSFRLRRHRLLRLVRTISSIGDVMDWKCGLVLPWCRGWHNSIAVILEQPLHPSSSVIQPTILQCRAS